MAAIDTFYPTVFETSWSQVLQQMDSRLQGAVVRSDFTGKQKFFNKVTKREMTRVIQRKMDTRDGEFDGYKYYLRQNPYDLVTTFDEFDQQYLGPIVLPTSDEVQAHAMAAHRTMDDVIIAAFDATRYIGEDGTTPDAFPAAQSIAANYVEGSATPANSGMTIGKLRRAKFLMDEDEVPKDGRNIVMGAQQIQDLLRTTEVTNIDYNTVKALAEGRIDTFLGFKFIESQRLPIGTVGGNTDVRSTYAFHSTALRFAMGTKKVYMDILPDRNHALQIRTVIMLGAARDENEKVVRIYADETP